MFQSANAWTTNRARSVSFLEVDRDLAFSSLSTLYQELIRELSLSVDETDKEGRVQIASIRNSLKAIGGRIAALQNSDVIRRKRAEERRMDRALPKGQLSRTEVDRAAKEYRSIARDYGLLEAPTFRSNLLGSARWIVRWAAESGKAESHRLPKYRGAVLTAQMKRFLEPPTINKKRETAYLIAHLRTLLRVFGPSHPICKELFSSNTPENLALAAVAGSERVPGEYKLGQLRVGSLDPDNNQYSTYMRGTHAAPSSASMHSNVSFLPPSPKLN